MYTLLHEPMLMDHSERVVINDGSNPHTAGREHAYPEIKIGGDEQIADADLTIDPNGLNTLKGRVLALSDHHVPRTIFQLKEEGAHDVSRLVEIEDDGTFQVNYLPPGSYILRITSSDFLEPAGSTAQLVEYKTVELTAAIADHDGKLNDVLLVPLKPGEKNPDFSIF